MIDSRQLDAFADDYLSKLGSPVSPRYLAGPGDPRHITHALYAAGWTVHSDPLHPVIRMKSPDLEHELVFKPSPHHYHGWWKVHSTLGPGHWYASFSGDAPVEIIAGLTDALVHPSPAAASDDFAAVLADRGWNHTADEFGGHKVVSPDRTTVAERRVSPSMGLCGWEIEAARNTGPYGPEGFLWRASLDPRTPGHVQSAIATALSDPAPVLRPRFEIDEGPHLQVGRERGIGTLIVSTHRTRLAAARRHRPAPPAFTPGTLSVPAAGRPARRR
ncbi:SPDY domain-containing protein [Streptomyces microflavus]|uniref:DUF317 domain-containing protein n=1 Tax=Streptomyces microflavus TaxID=1919 RepID=UPI002E35C290|nr:DUF317 domain-containing protein [Streptomyces microflavus]